MKRDHRPYYKVRQQRRAELRAFLRSLKSLPCADCGGVFDPVCMDFDHRPGEMKSFELVAADGRTMAEILAEVAKCDVVCSNCHRLRTFRQRDHAALCMSRRGLLPPSGCGPNSPEPAQKSLSFGDERDL